MAKTKKLLPDFDGDSLQDPRYQEELLEKAKQLLGEEPPVYQNSCLYCGGLASTPLPDWENIKHKIHIHKMYCRDCRAVYSIQ